MANGSFNVSTSNQYITGRVDWSSATDTENNRSTVTATLRMWRTNTGYTTDRVVGVYLTINGNQNYTEERRELSYNSNTLVGTHSVVVPHDTDGTKSITISVSGTIFKGTSGDQYTINSASKTAVLDTIPGQTYALEEGRTPNFNVGDDVYVSSIQYSPSTVADIYLEGYYDDAWHSIAADYASNTHSKTLTLTVAETNLMYVRTPNSKTMPIRVRVVTRLGADGPIQGTTYSSTGAATIVDANPVIAGVTYKDTNTTVQALLKNDQQILRNLSTLQVIAGRATGNKNATISKYKVTIGGNEHTVNGAGLSTETGKIINVGTVDQASNQTAVLTVMDSRGYTASISFTVQMIDYAVPQIIHASADRLNSYEESTTMNIQARYAKSVNSNTVSLRYRIKQNPYGSYGSYVSLSHTNGTMSGIFQNIDVNQYMNDYPSDKSYTVQIGIKDLFTSWKTILVTLTEGVAILQFLKDKIVAGVQISDKASGNPYIYFAESEEW